MFSITILGFIIEIKPDLSIKHMFELCRIVKKGPAPATKAAVNISKNAVEKWQGKSPNDNLTFISDKYMPCTTSKTVAKCLNK